LLFIIRNNKAFGSPVLGEIQAIGFNEEMIAKYGPNIQGLPFFVSAIFEFIGE